MNILLVKASHVPGAFFASLRLCAFGEAVRRRVDGGRAEGEASPGKGCEEVGF